jgi:3-oxoacyl-[acyl-carrier protein] reductase
MNRLENKAALVTGGSRGIGAAIAERLAAEGADVAFTYYNSNAEQVSAVAGSIEKYGRKALAIRADSANPQAVQQAVDQAAAALGKLDILVSNAAIAIYKPITDFSIADFDRVMAVNVRAVFAGIQAALRYMTTGSRILTIGSCNAERVPLPNGSLYAMSKSALVGLTKGIARDLGPKGITVNLVQPGPVDTDMNPANSPRADILRGIMAIPQYGSGHDVAGMVAYLASAESKFITGAALTIDGGYNI